ncbi:MAG: hypothetical protein E6Q35_02830 [Chryseobacterium cucumeris]|nr:MAG: hypothetical protein E6Q35_02830 [Chryseobacterium cucumeris]
MSVNVRNALSAQEAERALAVQRTSIPYFTTLQRLQIKFKPGAEKLLLYDSDENKFYIAYWTKDETKFEVVVTGSGGGGITRLVTNFSIQTAVSINHGFGYYPMIQIFDSAGYEIQGSVQHLNLNQSVILFNQPETGYVLSY